MTRFAKWLVLPFLLGCFFLLFFIERTASVPVLLTLFILFGIYIGICKSEEKEDLFLWFIGFGIFARFIAVFALPELSDDIYRFIWDGRLILSGINPFDDLPSHYHETGYLPDVLTTELFQKLNSPDYFTIYPPASQAIFSFSVWLFPTSIYGASTAIKACLFFFELGTLYCMYLLLLRLQIPKERLLWYALNPLVIIEICGNAHFEGVLLFFFFLSMLCLLSQSHLLSALFFALSVATKLLSVLFLPYLLRLQSPRLPVYYFLATAVIITLLFYPLMGEFFFNNFGESLDLYFRKFEYNGSLYYLARWIGTNIQGYNPIAYVGPTLRITSGLLILAVFIWKRQGNWEQFFEASLFAIMIYLLFATIVHPWYTILPLALCIFTRWRFPVYWSWAIMLTYINYSYPVFQENLWIVAFEYLSLLAFIFFVDIKQVKGFFWGHAAK